MKFSQIIGPDEGWLSLQYKLKIGKNVLNFDNFSTDYYKMKVKSGWPIYIENPLSPVEQSQNIKYILKEEFYSLY